MLGNQAFSVGNLLVELKGPADEARRRLEKAREIQAGLVDKDPSNLPYRRQLERTTRQLGRLR